MLEALLLLCERVSDVCVALTPGFPIEEDAVQTGPDCVAVHGVANVTVQERGVALATVATKPSSSLLALVVSINVRLSVVDEPVAVTEMVIVVPLTAVTVAPCGISPASSPTTCPVATPVVNPTVIDSLPLVTVALPMIAATFPA